MILCRPNISGPTGFFTLSLRDAGSSLLCDRVDLVRAAFGLTCRSLPFYADACVILPNHLHAVMTLPEGETDFARRWYAFKRHFRRSLPTETRVRQPLWQRGFGQRPVTGVIDYADSVRRCWFDPVRHGLAATPEEWIYSSIHREETLNVMAA